MSFKPGLILLDLYMPGIDGFDVCRKVKENPATAHIKILAVTGYGSDENRERDMGARADDFPAKPVFGATLIEHVANLLSVSGKSVRVGSGQEN